MSDGGARPWPSCDSDEDSCADLDQWQTRTGGGAEPALLSSPPAPLGHCLAPPPPPGHGQMTNLETRIKFQKTPFGVGWGGVGCGHPANSDKNSITRPCVVHESYPVSYTNRQSPACD